MTHVEVDPCLLLFAILLGLEGKKDSRVKTVTARSGHISAFVSIFQIPGVNGMRKKIQLLFKNKGTSLWPQLFSFDTV